MLIAFVSIHFSSSFNLIHVNIVCVGAVLNNACTLLESDFLKIFQETIKAGLPNTYLDQAYSVLHSATGAKLAGVADTDKQRQQFLACLNNAEVGLEYVGRLQLSTQTELTGLQATTTISSKQADKLGSCMTGLGAVATQLRASLDSGLAALRTSAVRPRLKPWIDGFCQVSHNLTEEMFSDYAANDPWVQQTIVNIDTLLKSFQQSLTQTNFDSFVNMLASEVTSQLEKAVTKSSFNRLGGLQFDKEVRSLSSFLTSITSWSTRDKFSRLQHIAAILNIEAPSEIEECSGINKLTPIEVLLCNKFSIDPYPRFII